MTGMSDNLLIPLQKEFKALFVCAKRTVASIPSDEWSTGSIRRCIPAWQACHMLEPLRDLLRSMREEAVQVEPLAWELARRTKAGDIPAQVEVIAFLDALAPLILAHLSHVVQKTCGAKSLANPPLSRWLYILRHSIIHLSYLRHELLVRDVSVPDYTKHVVKIMRSWSAEFDRA